MTDRSKDVSRRGLLQAAAVVGTALPLAARAASSGNAMRDQLLLAPDIHYFNAANIGPAFRSAIAAHERET